MPDVLFVGGVRHGRAVAYRELPREGEVYRALDPQGTTEYTAVTIRIAYPDAFGQPGRTRESRVFASEQVNPDRNQHSMELFQQGLYDAMVRRWCEVHGVSTDPLQDKGSRTKFVAWCDTCDRNGRRKTTFATPAERAVWLNDHSQTTGHTGRWENTED